MNVLYYFEYIILICHFLSDIVFHIKPSNISRGEIYMITNYLIYLYTLSRENQIRQILMLLAFCFLTLAFPAFIDFLEFIINRKCH